MIEKAVEGRLTVKEAADLLQVGERQAKQLKRKHNGNDAAWVNHGNRGRSPVNAIAEPVRRQVVELASGR